MPIRRHLSPAGEQWPLQRYSPFSESAKRRTQAVRVSFCFGVIAPSAAQGRSRLQVHKQLVEDSWMAGPDEIDADPVPGSRSHGYYGGVFLPIVAADCIPFAELLNSGCALIVI